MAAMNVSLTPELDSFVRTAVEGGRYATSSEVVRDALRLLQAREAEHAERLAWLRGAIEEGLASGPAEPWDVEALLAEARASTAGR
ncbi:CopG family transcriptional regulator [Polymorphobacter multimanifer]|uniref:Antitoxin ParD1/3/4 n=2 Tax=Polymorphobacter multimanifer TaxID=1070431 RepID=A0A841L5M4_9SPHN|nr:type II toxin-antitoxin system ParD family antitoxin [Polymorphobacter multimanifer]MBB6227907.1 antitoxin ParD1/3/4 [Polymorphobacter multimanifer]GGI83601.1 CopG family transcriptional regulator [Polymorphobacter multimanifer]